MEGKLLMGALRDPYKRAIAPKAPPHRPLRGMEWLEMTIEVKRIEDYGQNHEIRSVFLPIPRVVRDYAISTPDCSKMD